MKCGEKRRERSARAEFKLESDGIQLGLKLGCGVIRRL